MCYRFADGKENALGVMLVHIGALCFLLFATCARHFIP
jgi:hypothetical protein